MSKDWLKGLDDIRCEEAWKQDVLAMAEAYGSRKRRRRLVIGFAAVLFLAFGVTLTAKHDEVAAWLQELFSSDEKQAEVKRRPQEESFAWNIQEVSGITMVEDLYVLLDEEQFQQAEQFDVYRNGEKLATTGKQQQSITFYLGDECWEERLWYVAIEDSLYPLQPQQADGTSAASYTAIFRMPGEQNIFCVEIERGTRHGAYLVDMDTAVATPLAATQANVLSNDMYIYDAIDVKSSPNGTWLLYHTNYVDGAWAETKDAWQWVLYNVQEQTSMILDEAYTAAAILENELAFVGDHHIMTTMSVKLDDVSTTYYPLVYDCESKTWTKWQEYSCYTPFVSGWMYRQQEDGVELYHVVKQIKLFLEGGSSEDELIPYENFIIRRHNGYVQDIYLIEQQRWLHVDEIKELSAGRIVQVRALGEDTLLVAFLSAKSEYSEYVITLYEK